MDEKLVDGVKPGVVLPDEIQTQVKSKKPLETDAQLAVDRNKWFIGFILALLFAFYQTYSANIANERFANNVQVAWVKLQPNGTWDVTYPSEGQQPEFFKATIDSLLRQFAERRYSKLKNSVKADYGFVALLMSDKMESEFLDTKGYYAPGVAADVANGIKDEVKVRVKIINHYDSDKIIFNGEEGRLYRTNIFVTEAGYRRDGQAKKLKKRIVSVQWRIKTKKEISAKKNELALNPIGIELIDSEYLEDPSDN